jgi:hypothetical protein
MTTLAEVIDRTRHRLMSSQREPLNTLSGAHDSSQTAITFTNDVKFHTGVFLSVGLEDMYVTDVASSGTSCTVIRGMNSSTAAAHSDAALVRVNPTWSNWDILRAVNDEIHSLSAPTNGLFRMQSVEFDYSPAVAGYELVGLTDYLDVWQVRYATPGPEKDWPVKARWEWSVDRNANTTDFASGSALILHTRAHPGQKVRISYKATFDELATMADDVATVSGLHVQAHDILSLGAAIRLLGGYEAQRAYTTTQPDTRYAADVPPRTAVSAVIPLVEQREERIAEEQARLARQFAESI